eukprot:2264192-Alexandrium_andersonii.AAC.1
MAAPPPSSPAPIGWARALVGWRVRPVASPRAGHPDPPGGVLRCERWLRATWVLRRGRCCTCWRLAWS